MGTHQRSLASGEERTGDCLTGCLLPRPLVPRSLRAMLAQKSKPCHRASECLS